ncbi:MAG: response regulator, partial [Calditrichota bacterium]
MTRLLIVDDELSMLHGIEFHLQENTNYDILTASDRKTALELLESNQVDLVVSDLMLPDIEDGLEILRNAKHQWYQPTVLAMTAYESVENAVSAMKAGADDFISKGFGLDEMTL